MMIHNHKLRIAQSRGEIPCDVASDRNKALVVFYFFSPSVFFPFLPGLALARG